MTFAKESFETRMRNLLGRVCYKDWGFVIGKDAVGLYYLQVHFGAPNTSTGEPANWSGRKWRLSTHMTDSEIVTTALKAVLTAVEHEAREEFLYRGRAIFGPHLDVEKLWDLTADPAALDVRA